MGKVVVFGGAGFIGSHVADHLSAAGYNVTIHDLSPSQHVLHNQDMVVGNLLDLDSVIKVVENADVVFNFAAISDLNEALTKPVDTARVNVLGNVNVLEACRIQGVSRYVYASSVYVNSREGGFYGCSKKAAELFIQEYQRTYGLNYTILRYGSLYGPRADSRNGLRRIVYGALRHGSLKYNGSKDALRDYIHVRDAALASVDALKDCFINKKLILTGHQPIKVIDLLGMLAEMIDVPESAVEFRAADYKGHYIRTPFHYESDIAEKYVPQTYIDLGEGLLELIRSYHDED